MSESSQLRAFALLATLRTANDVRHALAERRAGRDPSEQEDAPGVRAYLGGVLPELRGLVARLRLGLVVAPDERVALVRACEDRLLLHKLARELHVVHQRLLSLYPEVPEELVERARRQQAEAERLATSFGEFFAPVLTAWLDRSVALFEGLAKELVRPN